LKGCKNRNSFKRTIRFYLIKYSFFYEIIITVFQFTQRAIENRSTYHTWHACRRLLTPALEFPYTMHVCQPCAAMFDAGEINYPNSEFFKMKNVGLGHI